MILGESIISANGLFYSPLRNVVNVSLVNTYADTHANTHEVFVLATELIKRLQKLVEIHGDMPVYHWDLNDEYSIDEVSFESHIFPHILLGEKKHKSGNTVHEDYGLF